MTPFPFVNFGRLEPDLLDVASYLFEVFGFGGEPDLFRPAVGTVTEEETEYLQQVIELVVRRGEG